MKPRIQFSEAAQTVRAAFSQQISGLRKNGLSLDKVFYGWAIVFVSLLLGFLGTGLLSYSAGVMLPSIANAIADGSRFAIALGSSIVAVVTALIAPALGKYLDAHSPKKVMLIGVLMVAVSLGLFSIVQSVWQYYVISAIGLGIGTTLIGTVTRYRAVLYWFDHWRGRALGIAALGASFSGIIFPPIVNGLIESYGWRVTYFAMAVLALSILLPVVYFLMKDRPEEIGEVRDGKNYRASLAKKGGSIQEEDGKAWSAMEIVKAPAFWSIGLIFGPMMCVYFAVMLHLYGHLIDIEISTSNAALALSVVALLSLAGKPIFGWLADIYGARVTIWLSLGLQTLALFGFVASDSAWHAFIAAASYGLGYSGMMTLKTFALSTSFGSQSLGLSSGLIKRVELPFVLFASPLAGFTHDVTGSYSMAFLVMAIMLLTACIGPFFISAGGARERAASPRL